MGSPAAAEEGGEEMGGEKCESVERSEVQCSANIFLIFECVVINSRIVCKS